MEGAAAKAAADAAAEIIKQGALLGSLLVLALCGCLLLGWLLYKAYLTIGTLQTLRVTEIKELSKIASDSTSNNVALIQKLGDLIKTIDERTPIQRQLVEDVAEIKHENRVAREGWSHRGTAIERVLGDIHRGLSDLLRRAGG